MLDILINKMKFFVPILLHISLIWAIAPQVLKQGARVIGGDNARAGQFPFAAAVHVRTSDSSFFCGGALLSNLWVVTAGHCVESAIEFTITLGSITLTESDSNRVTVSTNQYSLHSDFNRTTLNNDIGLIKFRNDVGYSDYINRIHLPVTGYNQGTNVTAIGWGQISDNESGPVEHLNTVELITLSNEYCKIYYGDQINDAMLCVSGQYEEGICTGDSGGPLIYYLDQRHPIIIGIASFHSGFGCEGGEPSGYIRVFPYREWILNITGSLT